tara:strand:+ start:50 stop:532 length:483 start_codon:yes stop_codon:yes gene_type:complete
MAYKQNSPLHQSKKKLFKNIGSAVGNILKPGKNKTQRLIDRNKNRLERNLRVDYDPSKLNEFNDKFKALYDETDERSKEEKLKDITENPNYKSGSGQGGTDIGNWLRQGKRNMILPTGTTNTTDTNKKDNNYANLFNYNLESEFYGNRYLAKYRNQTQEG